jgi:hypothetical protein
VGRDRSRGSSRGRVRIKTIGHGIGVELNPQIVEEGRAGGEGNKVAWHWQ